MQMLVLGHYCCDSFVVGEDWRWRVNAVAKKTRNDFWWQLNVAEMWLTILLLLPVRHLHENTETSASTVITR